MSRKYLVISSVLFAVIIIAFIGGYHLINKKNTASNTALGVHENLGSILSDANTNVKPVDNLNHITDCVSSDTIVEKKENYIEGIPAVIATYEKASPSIIGLSLDDAKEYFKNQGFFVTSLSNEKIIITKDIKAWPPNYYIVKVEDNKLKIFHTNENGELTFKYNYDMDIDQLPDSDLSDLMKGRAFESKEQIDDMFNELKS